MYRPQFGYSREVAGPLHAWEGSATDPGDPVVKPRTAVPESTTSREAAFDIAPDPTAPAQARRLVDEMMKLWDCDDPDDVAILLTSELITNVVRHARTNLRLEVSLRAMTLRIAATDEIPAPPQLRPMDTDSEGGRGLALINSLAHQWGITPRERGKTVWFEVVVQPAR